MGDFYNGYSPTNDVSLSVTSGLPAGTTATYSPNPAKNGTGYTSTLTVTTTAGVNFVGVVASFHDADPNPRSRDRADISIDRCRPLKPGPAGPTECRTGSRNDSLP